MLKLYKALLFLFISTLLLSIGSGFRFFTTVNNNPGIPSLTPLQAQANEKNKMQMISDLLRILRQKGNGSYKDKYAYVPSGSVNYKEKVKTIQAFFIQKTEVSNLQYRVFLNDLILQKRFADYNTARLVFPDHETAVPGEAYYNLYFTDPYYNDYPVVNIPRIGAVMYCQWLTEEAGKEALNEKRDQLIADLRLPMEEEWMLAAKGGNDTMIYAVAINRLSRLKHDKKKDYIEYEANYNVKGIDF